ncbi:MAG: fluoride efflux transporter CrcB [Bacteroidetes bacterium]|nr:MAG: fluoride efflux transporter CrcB [Bacteroidota bacterium]
MKYFYVFLGTGFGGMLRYLISTKVYKFLPSLFPYGTLAVNALGSFILGVLIFWFDDKELLNANLKLLLAVGFCGGLTTFSTFSFETFNLLRDSEFLLAIGNISLNLFITILFVFIAYIIGR